ncbi:PilW family protein [Coralloluteibacterium stylophorae]|uniref:PilW family protein n=1 Tax=Coralloluteibacterium stylophorae TaxID=1776034 RepID=A0A8J7VSI9_9GAMM|nr:PilW family protein [Coralloluteibacterium stylophorae]
MRGMSLIELMIAMALGLVVVGAAIGIFLSNARTYRATESLGRVQENVRIAFELMARDLREAGGNPCSSEVPLANVASEAGTAWWAGPGSWGGGLRGFEGAFPDAAPAFGTGSGARIAGTDAVQVVQGGYEVSTVAAHDVASGRFTLNTPQPRIAAGDLVLVCDARQASIFRAGSVAGTAVTVAEGGNCSRNLGMPACSGAPLQYSGGNAVLTRVHATRWFVGVNARGAPALFQARARVQAGGIAVRSDEILEGVTQMQLAYQLTDGDAFLPASAVPDWSEVAAVRVELTIEGDERVGAAGEPIVRTLSHVVALRNRNA